MKDIKNYALGVENNCQEKLRIRSRKKKFMRNYAFKVKKMMFSGRVMTLNKNTPTRLQQKRLISLIIEILITIKFDNINVKLIEMSKIS
jgi:hypothetical protein